MAQNSENSGNVIDKLRSKITGDEEAAEGGATKKEPEGKSSAYYTGRRSGASAKPSREKASGVTVVPSSSSARYKKAASTSQADLTKEERKRQRRELRDHEDQVNAVAEALAKQDPEYNRMRRLWSRMLTAGFASIIIAFIAQFFAGQGNEIALAIAAVTMIFSYICIIGALIYDLWKINKVRQKYQRQAEGMSDKRLQQMLNTQAQITGAELAAESDTLMGKIKHFFR